MNIDPQQIDRLISGLFAYATAGSIVSLRLFADSKGQDAGATRIRTIPLNGEGLGPVIEAATKLATEAAEHDHPMVLAMPIATFSSATAKEQHLQDGLALTAELDERPAKALAKLRAIIGSPTFVVASGGDWTDPATGEVQPKLHAHWRLSEPTQTVEEHQRLKRARGFACDLVGADASCKAIVHPLRLAGSLHRKDPTQPKLATIVEENPDSEIDLADVHDELEGMTILRDEISPRGPAPIPATTPATDDGLLLQCAERMTNADLPWAAWTRLGLAFWRASNGDEAGFAAFTVWSGKSSKYNAEETRARWAHFRTSPPDRIGIGTLVLEARKADPEFRRRRVEPGLEGGDETQDGLALAMGREWEDARYVALWGAWLFWDGSRWQRDERLLHMTRTRKFLRRVASEPRNDNGAKKLRSAQMVASVVGLACSNPEQAASVAQWDADPFLLPTVDLRTGIQRAPRPLDYITKRVAVTPAPVGTAAPQWMKFLERVTNGSPGLQAYLQRAAGYCLTGSVKEHALFFLHGDGGNGKSVFVNTLVGIWGDYAVTVGADMLMASNVERHPTELARLRGARLVVANEIERGKTWAEAKINSLTGGDTLQGRFMRRDFFEFAPQFKLMVAGNNKPSLRGVNEAIRRRLHLIPFTVKIPPEERDKDLPGKLRTEWPAILRWAIDGCLAWQREGLNPPDIVTAATTEYLAAEDTFTRWCEDCTKLDKGGWAASADLWASWKLWAEGSGEFVGKQRKLSELVEKCEGVVAEKRAGARGFKGIRLKVIG